MGHIYLVSSVTEIGLSTLSFHTPSWTPPPPPTPHRLTPPPPLPVFANEGGYYAKPPALVFMLP